MRNRGEGERVNKTEWAITASSMKGTEFGLAIKEIRMVGSTPDPEPQSRQPDNNNRYHSPNEVQTTTELSPLHRLSYQLSTDGVRNTTISGQGQSLGPSSVLAQG